MKTTIDKAGRLVVPRVLRDQIGLVPGEVSITAEGTALRIEPVSSGGFVVKDGRLQLAHGFSMTDEEFREFRLADQR